eukprot:s154_g23.t1
MLTRQRQAQRGALAVGYNLEATAGHSSLRPEKRRKIADPNGVNGEISMSSFKHRQPQSFAHLGPSLFAYGLSCFLASVASRRNPKGKKSDVSHGLVTVGGQFMLVLT